MLSIIIFIAGLVSLPNLPDQRISRRSCRPPWWCARPIPAPTPSVIGETVAAPLGAGHQRRRRDDLLSRPSRLPTGR
ncbi:hypothetical protein ACRAWD_03945 [Caulobacter segnis]